MDDPRTIDRPAWRASFRRTRIAPTPSGFLHLGNIYSFILTTEIARACHAAIMLRIDDMDRDRVDEKYIHDIFDTLSFLHIEWQEGPRNIEEFHHGYSQRHRLDVYTKALHQLAGQQSVFACECSRATVMMNSADGSYPGTCLNKNIPLDRPGVSWRLRTGNDPIDMNTFDGVVTMAFPQSQQYFVVRRNNGLPAYQLTSLMDDLYFGVDLIVRGEDLLDSTLAQLRLADHLQEMRFLDACFHHHPLLKDEAGRKMSKSAGATSIQYLRKQGRTKAEILAMINDLPGAFPLSPFR